MSSTVQYVKPPAKIGTQGSAEILATARTASTTEKPKTAGTSATATLKGTTECYQQQERQQWQGDQQQ
jgi:hypothetical protein